MPMNSQYNKLTQKLLAEGYTTEKYPEHVRINSSRFPGDDILNNLAGGFEYKQWYSDEIIYKTGCGKFVMGKRVLSNMSYQGISWTHENDNPVVKCPYDRTECPNNDKRLHGMSGGGLCIMCFCACHSTTDVYEYENSIEKADRERKEEKEHKYQEYSNAHNGRVCKNHMFYDEGNRTWHQKYEPERCAKQCYSQNGYCPILGRQLSKKRGNVYYDLKKSGIRHDDTLFNGETWTHITKGIRFFDKPCSMDICEAFVKIQSEEILNKYMLNHSWEKFIDKSIEVEILNIRAESKPSRDLIKDLEDLKNGITIIFDDDNRKQQEEYKKEKKKAAQQKSVEKLEKKLIEIGYWNMAPHSLDRIHADKWLGTERIHELEEIRKQKIKEKQNEPVQLSLFEIETSGD